MASYLDARTHGGRWLLRIEDLDTPRVIPGSADHILGTLERFGFEWDGPVARQSERTALYEAALAELRGRDRTFECSCSRTDLGDETRYPGHCRRRPREPGRPSATRLRVDPGHVHFTDGVQGAFRQDVAAAVGDPVLKRRDRLYGYLLAVVVDDAAQGVTHVVRGADLLDNTPRQIHLQRRLDLPLPAYAHVPVLIEADGRKLAKSARSVRLDAKAPTGQLRRVLELLDMSPPDALTLPEIWAWAAAHWNMCAVPKRLTCTLD